MCPLYDHSRGTKITQVVDTRNFIFPSHVFFSSGKNAATLCRRLGQKTQAAAKRPRTPTKDGFKFVACHDGCRSSTRRRTSRLKYSLMYLKSRSRTRVSTDKYIELKAQTHIHGTKLDPHAMFCLFLRAFDCWPVSFC